jgi:hypothetical protein
VPKEPSGRLKSIDIRSVWQDEAQNFTPWLASEEGLDILSEELGMDLELEGTEVRVGSYAADIVARDASSDRKVVVENQLDKTNHDHLGKCLVYASGLDASVVIWVTGEFTDEHRRALDFLNKAASPGLSFYGVEVKLWSIADSPPAPQLSVVARPDESEPIPSPELTETAQAYLAYWQALRDHMLRGGTFLKLRKPRPQHWYSIAVGRSRFGISLTVSATKRRLGCDIYMSGKVAGTAFELLGEEKEAIEAELGPLEWMELPKKKATRIAQWKQGVDIKDEAAWPSLCEWHKGRAEAFHRAFSCRIKALEFPEAEGEDEAEDE